MKWITFFDDLETHTLVDEAGLFVGEVSGCKFAVNKGWKARKTGATPSVPLGTYVDLPSAQRAVERAQLRHSVVLSHSFLREAQ